MPIIKVVNIKCGGCENSIKSALESKGFKVLRVDAMKQEVEVENGDIETAKKILGSMGYPAEGTKEAESFLKKAQSYVSCMIGRIKK